MGSNLSIAAALARMEVKIARHKAQQEHHAAQEDHHEERRAFHAEQKAIHEAEHRKVIERYETFKVASASIGEMLVDEEPAAPPPPPPPPEDVGVGDWRWLSRLMSRVIERKAPDEVFGATALIQEIQQRWGPKLRHRIHYELGYAHGVGNGPSNVFLVAREGTQLHFGVAPFRIQLYRSTEHLRSLLATTFAKMVQAKREVEERFKPPY